MKKCVSILLCLAVIMGLFSVVPFTASAATSGDYTYAVLADGTVEITDYKGKDTYVNIPATLDDMTVSRIGKSAFLFAKAASIVVPSTVTSIGESAFSGCINLTSITLPNSVKHLEKSAFYGCTKLAYVSLPSELQTIGEAVFSSCTSLTSIVIPASVTTMGGSVFIWCEKLTSVTIPNSVTSIGKNLLGWYGTKIYGATGSYAEQYAKENNYTFVSVFGITLQPKSVAVKMGATAKVTVGATGTGLTYKWYYKNKGASGYSYTSSFKGNSYSVTMDSSRVGRKVYCVIADTYGNVLATNAVTLNQAVTIQKQPQSVVVANGETAKVSVTAVGEGLTYKWFFKNKGASGFTYTSSFKGNSYSLTMDNTRAGRQVYCVISDKYGNRANTKTVTLNQTATIVTQPKSVAVKNGATAKVSVKAAGVGLTYKWYYKNKGASAYTYTSSFKGNSYSITMDNARAGRKVYCVITDKYGNKVTTYAVTLDKAVAITKQPQSVAAKNGATAKVTVSATGTGLTYKWYFKNKGASAFSYTSSFKGNAYSLTMDNTRAGRQVYCVVTDKYGNSVKSKVVTLDKAVTISKQPTSVRVKNGATAKVAVSATGVGLTYKWYYKNKGASAYTYTSSFKGNAYSITMDNARAGRQVYCVVTDKYGNSVKSNVVTLKNDMVYTPTKGGKRYHTHSTCGSMSGPRYMTISKAESLGFTPCQRCFK